MDFQTKIIEMIHRIAETNVRGAVEEYIIEVKKNTSAGNVGDTPLSAYSEGHTRRRRQAGLQTSKKDLQFSGTLLNSVTDIAHEWTPRHYKVDIGVDGSAYRRPDQRDSVTNQRLAGYLSEQQGFKNLLKLPVNVKQRIQQKWGVTIDD